VADTQPKDAAAPAERGQELRIGLLAAPGVTQELAEEFADTLPTLLEGRFPGLRWEVIASSNALVSAGAGPDVDLVAFTREQMLSHHWQIGICLTDAPLHIGRRPVTAHLSVSLGVGVVSVPALGAVDIKDRVRQTVLRIIEDLLTGGPNRAGRGRRGRGLNHVRARVQELQELSSPVGRASVEDEQTIRFVTATGQGNLRLLIGMVRANRPWRLVIGLSRCLVAALGVSAFGLTSPPIWMIADTMNPTRMSLLALVSLTGISSTLIVAHHLWENATTPEVRPRAALINLTTIVTVILGVLTLYLAMLIIALVCDTTVIAPAVIQRQLQHPVGFASFVKIAWVVTSLATLGGALGAALESGAAVREAAYGYRPSEET
jgi:hypothetical protein